MKVLISAGPTREFVDSVRFISNASSGRMGLALAEAAVKAGHEVTVVLGPVAIKTGIEGVRFVDVTTAGEMAGAVLEELGRGCDVFISAAAVADYTPEKPLKGKLASGGSLALKLKPTGKITQLAKKKFPKVFVVAFKAEFNVSSEELVERAFTKLSKEKLDLIVANDVGRYGMGSTETDAYIVDAKRNVHHIGLGSKKLVAGKIVEFIGSSVKS